MNQERNILDHIRVLVRWRRMILISFFVVTGGTAAVSLVLPKAYRAYATVYPPKSNQGSLGLGTLLGSLQGGGLLGSLGGGETISATDFVPVLQSERVRMAVADSFHLAERYGTHQRRALLDRIAERLQVDLSREQFLSVSYEADSPELAADLTNAFVDELQKAIQERDRTQMHTYREYLEQRLEQAERDMLAAEQRYNQFQQKNMAIDIETQAKAQIESASKVISSLVDLIVKRDIAAKMMAADNPTLKQLNLEIRVTNQALDNLLMGSVPGTTDSTSADRPLPGIYKPFREIPKLGMTAMQLMREVQIQNAIYQFVKQEYEKTRFEEGKETSAVIVLDRAVKPDTRSRPRRSLMVFIAGGLSLSLSCLLAFIFEAIGNLTPENRAKIEAISSDLRKTDKP